MPYHVCGAQQDGNTVCLENESTGGRGGAPVMYNPGGFEPGYIAPDPKDLDVFFAGAVNGGWLEYTNRRTCQSREVHPYPRMFSGEPSSALVERIQWTFPIIFSPVDTRVLYTATQHVWRTTNNGQSWDRISGDLTRHDPKTMGHSGGPITGDMNGPEVYATVFALAPGETDANLLWAAAEHWPSIEREPRKRAAAEHWPSIEREPRKRAAAEHWPSIEREPRKRPTT